MTSRFLTVAGIGSLSDGTADIFVNSVTVAGLDAGAPVRTGPTTTLETGDVSIAEVTNLQAELDSKTGWPADEDMDANNFDLTNVANFSAVNGVFSGTLEAKEIVSELKVQDSTFGINEDAVDDSDDIGFYGKRVPLVGTRYTGLVRDAATARWHLFDNALLVPPAAGEFATAPAADLNAGGLYATSLDRPDAGALSVGATNATSLAFAQPGVTSTFGGQLVSSTSISCSNGIRGGFFEPFTNGTPLSLGISDASTVLVGSAGAPTIIYGDATVKQLDVTGLAVPLPIGTGVSTSAVHLSKVGELTSVLGNLAVAGSMTSSLAMGGNSLTGAATVTTAAVDRATAGTLTIGAAAASSAIVLGKVGQTLSLPGSATFTDLVVAGNGIRTPVVDYLGGSLLVGAPNATALNLAQPGVTTAALGPLQVNEALSALTTSSLQGAVTYGSGGTTYTFPTARGGTGQALVENGAGAPAWTSVLPLSGGTMSGDLDMGGHDISNVGLATTTALTIGAGAVDSTATSMYLHGTGGGATLIEMDRPVSGQQVMVWYADSATAKSWQTGCKASEPEFKLRSSDFGDVLTATHAGAASFAGALTAASVATASVDRATAGTLALGAGALTSALTLGKAAQALSLPGLATFDNLITSDNGLRGRFIDFVGNTLELGTANATAVNLARAGVLTTAVGSLTSTQAFTASTTSALVGVVTLGTGGTNWTLPTTRATVAKQLLVDSAASGAPVWGQGTLAASLSDVSIAGPATPQVLAYNGAAWANRTVPRSATWCYGATLAAGASYLRLNGTALDTPPSSSNQNSSAVAPFAGTVYSFTYNTSAGTTTSEFAIHVNGAAATTFTLPTNTMGVKALAVAVASGDEVAVRWTNTGTLPLLMSAHLYLLES